MNMKDQVWQVVYGDEPVPVVMSFWKPTPEELALLNANGCIQLGIVGCTNPPLWMEVVEQ